MTVIESISDAAASPQIDGEWKPVIRHGGRIEVLAPMVRAGTLPLRLEALRYGADLVWGEEIIDRKLIGCVRRENPAFGITDYVSPREQLNVFSTCPEERSRVIFQLGTASGPLAAEAAQVVCNEVRGIDVNMGCPKSFSVKGGMGAALLDKPEVVEDILKTLRRTLPSSCSLTCKIRMLPTTKKTIDFLQVCERSGAEAITVHMRLREERPAEPAHWDEIVKLWDAVKVPMLANGDFFTRRQIDEFWKHCEEHIQEGQVGPSGIMIARGAMWNPSIFCKGREPPHFEKVIQSYTRASVAANATYQNTKWVLSQMCAGGIGVTVPTTYQGVSMKAFNRQVGATKNMKGICEALGEPFEPDKWPEHAHTTRFYRGVELSLPTHKTPAVVGQKRAAEEVPVDEPVPCDTSATEEGKVDPGVQTKRPRIEETAAES
eukprot:TRINITY_DN79018_c0_g1_i1.p1 TRINITY_DN79018_c0_g1~~TRINITY_DN79018_c0_g1_i1.p1  ORF type:complete len:433 (-),score=67.54 TRINITY_DN79018_c0_g1_i1:151-1449(-)